MHECLNDHNLELNSMKGGSYMHFGLTEILIIAGIIVLLFGARKLPELAKGLGSSIKEFKKGLENKDDESKQ